MRQDNLSENPIKLIAVGDTGVGKSSILTRFVSDKFNQFNQPTLGAAFLTKKYKLPGNEVVQFQIWDTAGQQKYKSIAPIYYKQAKVALCVYDICSNRSYEVLKSWVEQLQANGPKDIILAVVGNKIDRYDEQQVNYNDVKQYSQSIGAVFKLVSAKEGKNINDLFNAVGQLVIEKGLINRRNTTNIKPGGGKKKKSTCC